MELNKIKKLIKEKASQLLPEIIKIRRHLHANPELSFQEFKTAEFISDVLTKNNIEHKAGIAGTGIVGFIKGNGAGKTIALRADMDALPITEQSNVDYKSKNQGVMHACGHDVHSSCLLGAAIILNELKEYLNYDVKLIFQPGEEKLPGGASLMIKEGVLKNPEPQAIFGQHVMPFIDAGRVGFRSGKYMASTDEIYVTVKGKGGHAAMPHLNIDPVLIAANIIVSLQQIVSRVANPAMPSVLSFGKIIANGATNIIPDEVKMEGTFRTFDEKWREEAHKRMKKMAESIATGMGGQIDFKIEKGYPFLINNEELTAKAKASAIEFLGEENVQDLDIWMAAEDFAFYSQQIPACFYRLGTRNESKGIISSVHTPTFDIEENALETGMGLMAWMVLKN
jgi:amidohydrolase